MYIDLPILEKYVYIVYDIIRWTWHVAWLNKLYS